MEPVVKSTYLARAIIINLVGKIEHSLKNDEFVLGAILDVEGAFNYALPLSLFTARQTRGIENLICNWINNMLTHRNISPSLQGEAVRFKPARGCTQEGVLLPLLWTIVVDDLLNILSKQGVEIQCYADDLAFLVRGKHEEVISNILQQALNTIRRWCDKEEMSVIPCKTVIVPFTLRN